MPGRRLGAPCLCGQAYAHACYVPKQLAAHPANSLLHLLQHVARGTDFEQLSQIAAVIVGSQNQNHDLLTVALEAFGYLNAV